MVRRTPAQYNWEKLEFDEMLMTKHFTPKASRSIKYFVVHHMIILNRYMESDDALRACYNVWQTRPASAHYGVDGDFVAQFVYDRHVAWANGNSRANNDSISVEHANATLDEPGTHNDYVVDERTFYNGARLIANGHHLFNLTPTKNITIRRHGEFSATACPGPYMVRNFNRYQDLVHDMYNEIKIGNTDFLVPDNPVHSTPQPGKLDLSAIAREVINGAFGNMPERAQNLISSGYNPDQVQAEVNRILDSQPVKDLEKIVQEVIDGKWGNGVERFQRLMAAGFNANNVQKMVNDALAGFTGGKTLSQLATEVINGAWGNAPERRHRLIAAGYDADRIQREVNRRLG